MIIYFAGSGQKEEDDERLLARNSMQWGVLLSFKDLKKTKRVGSVRFTKLMERRKYRKKNAKNTIQRRKKRKA